jgi:hypothetical protein
MWVMPFCLMYLGSLAMRYPPMCTWGSTRWALMNVSDTLGAKPLTPGAFAIGDLFSLLIPAPAE